MKAEDPKVGQTWRVKKWTRHGWVRLTLILHAYYDVPEPGWIAQPVGAYITTAIDHYHLKFLERVE